MLDLAYFWLGSFGNLTPIPIPSIGVSNTLSMVGTEHLSLIASRTVDVHGWRRTWTLNEAWLEPDDVGLLEAYYTQTIGAPLRIIDPLRKNRAFPGPAAGYSLPGWYAGIYAFTPALTVGHGFASSVNGVAGPDISYTSVGDARVVEYAVDRFTSWDLAGSVENPRILYLNGPQPASGALDSRYMDVVIPGETLTYSIYVRCLSSATVSLAVTPVSSAGVAGTTVSSSSTTSGTWTRLTRTYTVPSDGSVAGIIPSLRSSAALGVVYAANAQLEVGSSATNWVMGLGSPEVAITELNSVSPRYPLVTADLVIKEL